jgi:3-keto-5-aminohexanoate cleavage enzyme
MDHWGEAEAMAETAGGAREPVAVAVAPNGARRTKVDHPALPMSVTELAEAAAACRDTGAAMIHLHVRDREGRHLLDAGAYGEAITAIRKAVGSDLVIQITTEAVGRYAPDEQAAVLRATAPEAASLALREFVPGPAHEPAFADLLAWMARENVLPQIILYEPAEAAALAALQQRGLIPWQSVPVLFVLGRYSPGQRSEPGDLLPFLAPEMPRFTHWSVCAFGAQEARCAATAAFLGGHVRVGFENNLHLPDGRLAKDNAELVGCVVDLLGNAGQAVAKADQLRAMLRRSLASPAG